MTALRLHGTCPSCAGVERLRSDGTVVQHAHTRYWGALHGKRCSGSGAVPVAGSVAAWLDAQDADARAGVERAERALAEAAVARDRAIEHADVVTKATAKARARLARKEAE